MAADMICAYYDREADSRILFENLKVSKNKNGSGKKNWDEHLGEFDVIGLLGDPGGAVATDTDGDRLLFNFPVFPGYPGKSLGIGFCDLSGGGNINFTHRCQCVRVLRCGGGGYGSYGGYRSGGYRSGGGGQHVCPADAGDGNQL